MKWNQDIRRIMYKRLLEEFGPCSKWNSRTNPTGNKEDWTNFCNSMARGLTQVTNNNFLGKNWEGSAVEAQIAWGIQEKQNSCINTGAITNFVYNRSMALEIGLIKSSDMPNYGEFGWEAE